MNDRPLRLLQPIVVIVIVLAAFAGPAAAQPLAQPSPKDNPKRVMLLHSFGREFKPWSDYAAAIRKELDRQSPSPIEIIEHSLVSARSSDEDPEKPFVDYLRALFAKRAPDLVIGVGAPAANFVQRYRPYLFEDTPMVFTAVDRRRVQFSKLTANDVVVAVNINYRSAFDNILHVLPDTKAITVVVGTSPIEKFWKGAIGKEVEPLAQRVKLSWTDQLTLEGLLQTAASMPPQSAFFWELMIVDAAGAVHEGNEPLAKVHAVSKAPIFSYDESFFGREIVGGPFLHVADTSRQTVAAAMRILGGEKPSDIQIPAVEFGRPMFDWREMQRWGIPESRLPVGSEIHFREPTVWEQYRLHILVVFLAFVIQVSLITWLIYEHWRRRIAEADSLQRMNELARLNRVATAGELSASLAHEIRQPLATIAAAGSAGLNWLRGKAPNLEEARQALEQVINASYRADDVIKGVRTMFKREAAERVPVDVSDLVQQVLLLVERPIRSNDIALTTAFVGGRSSLVFGDPVQLQQVILNLIMNAIEALSASDQPGRALHIETRAGPAGSVLLLVRDTGPGFDAKVAKDLFRPFVTTKPNGMGMGLPICKSIIEQHGGTLTAVSAQPRGAVFEVVLPRAP